MASSSSPPRPADAFRPSRHGFRFANRFALPLPGVLRPFLPTATYGLCGGMAALARDAFVAGVPLPTEEMPPAFGTPLYGTLWKRQMATLGPPPSFAPLRRFVRWTRWPDHVVRQHTESEGHALRHALAQGRLVQLGLVYERHLARLWHNHQVLAYGLAEADDGGLAVRLYDPNWPLRDDVVLRGERRGTSLTYTQYAGRTATRAVRGFFIVPIGPAAVSF